MIHRFCVAPMMDRTDRHERFFLRSLTKKAYLYTEMINAQAILYGKTEELLMHDPSEHPIGIQLGGNDPAILTEAAIIAETYNYDEINLNIGCPSSKVQSGQFGAILMKNPELVSRCVEEIKKKVKVPVTVKCRIGVDNMDEQIGLSRFVNQVSKSGCSLFILHARKALLKGLSPKENRNIPPLNYKRVYELKDEFPELEIIINGGIETLDQCKKHLKFVDGVMMGRRAYDNPYQLLAVDNLFYGLPSKEITKRDLLLEMIPYLIKQYNSGLKLNLICRHYMGLTKGLKFAKQIRSTLSNIDSFNDPEKTLNQIANQLV
tara:strand:+ start:1505 stop:2461 length:957 start_codon:yes stop_codon:yes gene_type:complete